MKREEAKRIIAANDAAKEFLHILLDKRWPLDKIARFRKWFAENQDSANVPWMEG